MEPIQIDGKRYFVNVARISRSTATGDVNFLVEMYDKEPTWENGVASVPPVHAFQGSGDAGTLYHLFTTAFEVLNFTRST